MRKKERAAEAVNRLEKLYPDAICSLEYNDAFQLLIATRLSAQCTDARVNMVTPALFKKYPDAESMAVADKKRLHIPTSFKIKSAGGNGLFRPALQFSFSCWVI